MRRTLRPLVALAVLALLGAACSNTSADSGGSGGSAPKNNARTQAVKFAQCMRTNGVTEFPDPDASGQLTIDGVANNSSVNPNTAAFEQALSACKDLEPSGFTGHKRTPQEQANALRFAQCIRDHGVRDFPDPGPHDPLVDTNRIPSAAQNGGMSILNAAMRQCREFAAGAGVTAGP